MDKHQSAQAHEKDEDPLNELKKGDRPKHTSLATVRIRLVSEVAHAVLARTERRLSRELKITYAAAAGVISFFRGQRSATLRLFPGKLGWLQHVDSH